MKILTKSYNVYHIFRFFLRTFSSYRLGRQKNRIKKNMCFLPFRGALGTFNTDNSGNQDEKLRKIKKSIQFFCQKRKKMKNKQKK